MKKSLLILSLLGVLLSSCTAVTINTPTSGAPTTHTIPSDGVNKAPVPNEEKLYTSGTTIAPPRVGSGSVVMTIFADFQCPACINFHKAYGKMLHDASKNLGFVIEYRQYPLTVMHQNAYRDALAALCAHEQGKYMEFKDAMYDYEGANPRQSTSDANRIDLVKNLGLDTAKFTSCLKDAKYAAQVNADMAYANTKQVPGTPTLLMNGVILSSTAYAQPETFKLFLENYPGIKK